MEKPGGQKGAPRRLRPEKPDPSWSLSNPAGDRKVARMARQRKRNAPPFPTFCSKGRETDRWRGLQRDGPIGGAPYLQASRRGRAKWAGLEEAFTPAVGA